MPDFALESAHCGLVAGIDEAGRGPWAGPVVAAAAILDPAAMPDILTAKLNDSKKLSRTMRETLFAVLQNCAVSGVGIASVAEIEQLNILAATMLAMRRAVLALPAMPDLALVDGNRAPDLACAVQTVVKGEARSYSIAAASVVAKVTRDRIMAALAAADPRYGWETNQGYGTAAHRAALDRHGVTPHHRRGFKPIACRLK
ncbi:MAG: Ribonuclease HII [Alphaproteobacteria bacterium MarineAlpha10_Bin3]|jgi:ribonuclease HII|nr:MAG: Ribonuclease HII [Alphaproteobacteria bacterium MarineAlpha10_Bin3]PPR72772.1 MAG: Ribonuclease HII [Alphaproteobacteria bacterium MarineAlpha4_Bin1]